MNNVEKYVRVVKELHSHLLDLYAHNNRKLPSVDGYEELSLEGLWVPVGFYDKIEKLQETMLTLQDEIYCAGDVDHLELYDVLQAELGSPRYAGLYC